MSNTTAHRQEVFDKVKAIRKAADKKKESLPILLMQSDLYDYNPGARMVLMVIALGQRTNPDAYVPEDCPCTKEEMLGWCDMAQWRIALRVGKSEPQVHKDIIMFEKDGVIDIRRWKDSNKADHDMYRINMDVVREHQRPAQKANVERPSRYKNPRPKKGWFSTKNQPHHRSSVPALRAFPPNPLAEMDEE